MLAPVSSIGLSVNPMNEAFGSASRPCVGY